MHSGFLFAVAGVQNPTADGRFINDPEMQEWLHQHLEKYAEKYPALEEPAPPAAGVEEPAPPAAVVEEPATAMQMKEEEPDDDGAPLPKRTNSLVCAYTGCQANISASYRNTHLGASKLSDGRHVCNNQGTQPGQLSGGCRARLWMEEHPNRERDYEEWKGRMLFTEQPWSLH